MDRWQDGGGLVHGGEEVAGEELRLHGDLLQPGVSTIPASSDNLFPPRSHLAGGL